MRPLATLARVEASLLLREPAALFFTLVLPLILLVLNGSAGADGPPAALDRASHIDALVAGLLLLVMCTSGLMALPETLASYRERGFLRRLQASPLRAWQILGAHAATHLAVTVVGLVLLAGLGSLAFELSPPTAWPAVGAAIAASAVAVIAFGFLLAAVLPTVRTTQAVAAAVYFPGIFVSGAVLPVEHLPAFAQQVGAWLPFTYGVRAIREAWAHGGTDEAALAVLAATTLVSVGIALRTFRWEGRY